MPTPGTSVIDSGSSPRSFSVTVPGADGYIVVELTPAPGSSGAPSLGSATVDGAAMTVKHTDTTTSGSRQVRIFEMTGLSSGSKTVAVSWTGGGEMRCMATPYSGVHATVPSGSVNTYDGTGGATSTSHTITTVSGDAVHAFMTTNPNITGIAATGGGDSAILASLNTDPGNGYLTVAAANKSATTTSEAIGISFNETVSVVGWAFAINQASGGGGGSSRILNRQLVLGVG